jgi:hypothetical protein
VITSTGPGASGAISHTPVAAPLLTSALSPTASAAAAH